MCLQFMICWIFTQKSSPTDTSQSIKTVKLLMCHIFIVNCNSLTVTTDGFQCFYLQKSDSTSCYCTL